jgi:aspartate/methionine/tyrosine aminotransferase
MKYQRMPIEVESPEELGYTNIQYNLAESSVRDRTISDLRPNWDNLVLNYSDHRGMPSLRRLICENSAELNSNDVLVTQSAAMALFIVNTSLLSSADHLIVIRPNYATNIETPRAIGAEITFIDLDFENNYQLDIDLIKYQIKPNTKLISITNPHNPTGVEFDMVTIFSLIDFLAEKKIYLLVDETYRELNFQSRISPYFAEKSKYVISISSVSKAFGLPGIRIGWLICKNEQLQLLFLAAKEQIIITNSVIDEYLANLALEHKSEFLKISHERLSKNFEITKQWMQSHPYLEWNEPKTGAIAFLKFKENIDFDFSEFYNVLLKEYGTQVGPGHWFEQSDRYFRLGFGYPTEAELRAGLLQIDKCISLFII